jgi:predicted methyltransferase
MTIMNELDQATISTTLSGESTWHVDTNSASSRRRFLRLALLTIPGMAALPALASASPDAALRQAIDSDTRSASNKARDIYRHPEQSLLFWGLKPGDTVIEVEPGGGWWTEILLPYLAQTGGHYIAAGADLNSPNVSEEDRKDRAAFEARFNTNPKLYGKVNFAGFSRTSGPLAAPNSVDFVLVARETHNWVRDGFIKKAFADFYAALKPGGVMAIEDHRAPDGADPAKGNGYIPESYVIAQAMQAGFKLAAKSEINANPKDTKDHPFGVWTLPPVRSSGPGGPSANPNFDHTKYDAIGESDRMTLKFVKPGLS